MSTRWLHVVLTAWAGSLWSICGIVAPGLFAVLPDRHLAGDVAGFFFTVLTWLGLVFGAVALLLVLRGSMRNKTNVALTSAGMLAPVASEMGLRAPMESARVAGSMVRFGILHGLSVLSFAIAGVCVLALVWRLSGPAQSGSTQPGPTQPGNTIRG